MAKHCTVCKQSYPDHLQSCPHCAEAVEVIDTGSPVEISDPDPQGVVVELKDVDAEIIRGTRKLTDSNSEVDLQLPNVPPSEKSQPSSDSEFDIPKVLQAEKDQPSSDSEFDIAAGPAAEKSQPSSDSEFDIAAGPAAEKSQPSSDSEFDIAAGPAAEDRPKVSSVADIGLPPVKTADSSESDVPLGEPGPTSGEPSVVWASTVEQDGVSFGEKPDQVAFDSPSDVDLLKYVQSQEAAASPPPASPAPLATTAGPLDPGQPSGLGLVGDALQEGESSGVVMGGGTTKSEVESGLHLAEMSSTSMSEGPSGRDWIADGGESAVDLLNRGTRISGKDEPVILKGAALHDDSAVDLGSSPDTAPGASDEPHARTDLPALSGRSLYQSESELELNVDAIEEEIDLPSHVVVTEQYDPAAQDEKHYAGESLPSVAGLASTSFDQPARRASSRKGLLTGAGIGAVGGMALASIVWMSGVFGPANKGSQNASGNSSAIPAATASLDPAVVQNLKDQGFALDADPKPADVVVLLLAKQTQVQNEAKANKELADQAVKDLADLKKKGTDVAAVDKSAAEKKLKDLQEAASSAMALAKEATEKLKTAAEEAKTAKADSAKVAALLKTNEEELKAAKASATKAD
ncbi:MAG TPA: hypothetical protein VGZ25_11485, partial [Gemmataceae bacterium]|nr:hypothetical protein [Gemmataceae bacterium]